MSLLTSFLIAALGLVAIKAIGKRSPVLTFIVLATLLALPLIGMLPKVHVALPAVGSISTTNNPSLGNLFLIYCVGLAVFGSKLVLDWLAFRHWTRGATLLTQKGSLPLEVLKEAQRGFGYHKSVAIHLHSNLATPVACGLLRPSIHLPEVALTWRPETLRAVLSHELGHHVRYDLWTSLGARLACVLHWFNPLAWLLRRQHLEQCELACDARVLATGIDPKSYAHTLCDLALPRGARTPALALTMATKSGLRDRIDHLLAPRRPLTILPVAATLLLTLGSALALSTLRPAFQQVLPVPSSGYSAQEVQLRLTANPFPAN